MPPPQLSQRAPSEAAVSDLQRLMGVAHRPSPELSATDKRIIRVLARMAGRLMREGVSRDDAWRIAFAEHGVALGGVTLCDN